MKIGIVGLGHVGGNMLKLFKNAVTYDKYRRIGSMDEINKCDAAFVCVPTPPNEDGSCDTSIVESVIKQCKCNIIILRSTVRIGFTDEMSKKYKKNIVFQPEYYGETVMHPFVDLNSRSWLSFGGTPKAVNLAIKVYKTVINSNVRIYIAPAKEVEMAKYMENAYLATKVIFCNEMYDICQKLKIDYNQVREIWTADPRIGTSHTFVYDDNRGYSGSCLPKDVSSIRHQAKQAHCDTTFIDALIKKNKLYRK